MKAGEAFMAALDDPLLFFSLRIASTILSIKALLLLTVLDFFTGSLVSDDEGFLLLLSLIIRPEI